MLDGRLRHRTPEGIVLSLAPAGPAPRLWAWAVDTALWVAILIAGLLVLGELEVLGDASQGMLFLFAFLLWWGWPMAWEALDGRTPGKRLVGLRVVRRDGLPIGWREAFLRGLLMAADFLPLGYATGLVCMLFVPGFQRLGDLAAGTVVVHDPKPPKPRELSLPPAEPCPFPLVPDDQRALLDFAERASRVPPARLDELGDLAAPLTGLTGRASAQRLLGWAAELRA